MEKYLLKNLSSQGKNDEIIRLWNDNIDHSDYNEWDYLYTMNSFYKAGKYSECINVFKACESSKKDTKMLRDKMGWSLYHTKLKGFNKDSSDAEEFITAVDYILEICPDVTTYSPRWRAISSVVSAIENNAIEEERDSELIEKYLNKVSVKELSDTENNYNNRKLPSERETWYSHMTKALLELNKYSECISCCDEALNSLDKFHSNNDVWFKYRKARSLRMIGKPDQGMEIIDGIREKKHWCLYDYLFENAAECGDNAAANINAAKCAIFDDEHKMRVRFYQRYAGFLENNGNTEEAMLLRKLILLIYDEEGWNVKSSFKEWPISDKIANMEKPAILQRLNAFWKKYADNDKISGTVSNILKEGQSGFIKGADGKDYYFNAKNFKGSRSLLQKGLAVKFVPVEKWDNSKNRMGMAAIEIVRS